MVSEKKSLVKKRLNRYLPNTQIVGEKAYIHNQQTLLYQTGAGTGPLQKGIYDLISYYHLYFLSGIVTVQSGDPLTPFYSIGSRMRTLFFFPGATLTGIGPKPVLVWLFVVSRGSGKVQ